MMKILFLMLVMFLNFNNFWLVQGLLIFMSFYVFFFYSLSFYSYIYMFMGMDNLSFILILLSIWISFLMIMSSEKFYYLNNFKGLFNLMILFLLMSLIMVFSSLNLLSFYLFFEFSIIPTLILILGWGYQPERIQAGMYLFFYMMVGSLPILLFIFYYYKMMGTMEFAFFEDYFNSIYLYLICNMVFFLKIPMFLVHLWLPKAHVEAPVSGSMILAGVMLKLGGYGLLRFLKLFMEVNMKINFIFINLSLMGGFIISLICLRQMDMKSLIAYSSVVHMGMMLAGLITLFIFGKVGSLILMVGHGLCSSGLFVLVNMNYERLFSRSIYLNKGMINLFPSLSLWWFLLVSSNMAAPPSLNLLGEIMMINSLVSYSSILMILLMLLSFFSACYSIFLFSFTQHGKIYSGNMNFSMINLREYLILFLHWVPLNLLFLKSDLFLF